jgi:hypothetical protein
VRSRKSDANVQMGYIERTPIAKDARVAWPIREFYK